MLFDDAEPGGRLAESIPVHVAQLPADRCFPGHPRQVVHREGLAVGYRFHDTHRVPARFPFGHGLSYTSFAWTDVAVDGEGTDVAVTVRVTNTGDRPGRDVVQVYVRDREASVPRSDKELKGFAKVHLEPGASEVATVALDRRAFAVWDVSTHSWLVEAGTFDIVVARSSADPVAELAHHVDSTDEVTPVPRPGGPVMTDDEVARVLGHPIHDLPPTRPFTRTSTLEEIESTAVGRVISAQIVRMGLREATEEFPDPDAATVEMIRCAVREGPARGLVQMGGGPHLLHRPRRRPGRAGRGLVRGGPPGPGRGDAAEGAEPRQGGPEAASPRPKGRRATARAMALPRTRPSRPEATVFTSHPSTPPMPATPWTASSRWWTTS